MRKTTIVFTLLTVISGFIIGGYFYNKSYHEKIKNSQKMYPYQTYYGPANPVFIIDDINYKETLNAYYDTIARNPLANPIIRFPIKTLPMYEFVYVMGYTEDGTLADVVSYYDRGKRLGGSYTRGWVCAKTLHEKPPPK